MPLQDVIVPVELGSGIDTKTDPKKVLSGQYLLIENGVFTKLGQVRKRSGYTKVTSAILGGGNLVSPGMVRVFENELVCQDQGSFYGFSETLNCWIPKGNYQSIDISNRCFFTNLPAIGQVDVATLNGVTVYSGSFFLGPSGAGSTGVYAAVVDQTDGNFLLEPTKLQTISGSGHVGAKAVQLGTTALGVVYDATGGTGGLALNILTSNTSSVSFGAPITLDASGSGLALDVATTSTGFCAVYEAAAGAMKLITVDVTGTVTHSVTLGSGAGSGFISGHVNVDPTNGNIWVYWIGASNQVCYAVYSPTLTPVLAVTNIQLPAGALTSFNAISAMPISTTQQKVYWGFTESISSSGASGFGTNMSTVTSTGLVASPAFFLAGVFPRSRITTVNSRPYMVMYKEDFLIGTLQNATTSGGSQNTYFLIDINSASAVGRFASERAYTGAQLLSDGANLGNFPLTGSSALFGGTLTQNAGVNIGFGNLSTAGAFIWTFTWGTNRTYKSEVCGDLLIGNGAMLSAYDGGVCAEWGFNMRPEIVAMIQTSGTSGSATHIWQAVYEWVDAQGNLHQSEPSNPVVTTASTGAIWDVYVSSLALTGKSNVQVVIYRSLDGGTVLYETAPSGGGFPPISVPADQVVVVSVASSDAQLLAGGEQIYTTGGVLENNPPAPSMVLTPRLNRLWYVDAENTNNTWYSKSFETGTGLSPSASLLIEGNPDVGPILGLSPMDDKLIFFKEHGITWCSGDGAGDTGQGNTLSFPQNLPTDVGIKSGPSIVLTPKGIIFQNNKGLYLLDRSLNLHYSDQVFNGAAAEQYNNQTISDARIVTGVSQVRMLTQSGSTLVYDYIFDKFGTFTNHLGVASDNWKGSYVYLRTDGKIYLENSTSYLDDATAFALRLQTSWLDIAGIQGFERMRHCLVLGDQITGGSLGHGLQLSFAYDFIPTFSTAVPYIFSTGTSSAFQYRTFPIKQKCDSVSLLIEEITTGASGEFIDLTNLSFNAGVKKGLNKVTASNSVG